MDFQRVSFGCHLRELRERANLSQSEIAQKIGVAEWIVELFEDDTRIPNRRQTYAIARAVRADDFWLMQWRETALHNRRRHHASDM